MLRVKDYVPAGMKRRATWSLVVALFRRWAKMMRFLVSTSYIVPERKPYFSPISASGSNFNPQNTPGIPAVKIFAVLNLDEKSWFSFGHYKLYGFCHSMPGQPGSIAVYDVVG